MVRKGRLITPPSTENVLEGITRDSILQLARHELGIEVVERPIGRSELYVSDELFFTGTAVGVAPVVRVDHRPVKDGDLGPITREVGRLYFDATHGHLRNYENWLEPVYGTRMNDEQDALALEEVNAS
jgi:branched-chain amino acid aminotransferase